MFWLNAIFCMMAAVFLLLLLPIPVLTAECDVVKAEDGQVMLDSECIVVSVVIYRHANATDSDALVPPCSQTCRGMELSHNHLGRTT